jgi:hypothetical protein
MITTSNGESADYQFEEDGEDVQEESVDSYVLLEV